MRTLVHASIRIWVRNSLSTAPKSSGVCRHTLQPVLAQVFLTAEYLAIAMEYAAGGDMYHCVVHCRGLHEADARWYFQQLIIAIDYCHRMVCDGLCEDLVSAAPSSTRMRCSGCRWQPLQSL